MGKIKDLHNKKFGRLKVIKLERIKNNRALWLCRCDCGNMCVKASSNLLSNGTKSCGCIHREQLIERNKTHNYSHTSLYNRWKTMKVRCSDENCVAYKNYGGRGIKVCDEWKNDFMSFYKWAILNGYKEELTIDRINNNGDYEPDNCRWVSRANQNRNFRKNHMITYNNETLCLTDMAKKYNITNKALSYRLQKGWDIEKALTTPMKNK